MTSLIDPTAVRRLAIGGPVFPGHFPGAPVASAALLMEALVDLAACGLPGLFFGLERARFTRRRGPGEIYRIELREILGNLVGCSCVGAGAAIATGRPVKEEP